MNHRMMSSIVGTALLLTTLSARADLVVYDISQNVSRTVLGLGGRFVAGCAILAVGMVVAAIILRRK